MGGDNAPGAIVNGCVDALNETEGFDVILIGDSKQIVEITEERKFNTSRLAVVHTTEIITNEDKPTRCIREKKESSMVTGFNMLKEKKGDAFISAGSTGALMAGALFILGRIKGVDRPALAAVIPTSMGGTLLIDVGLNTMCKPINFLQFGTIGSIYMKEAFNIDNPRVGLLNVGSEQKKGNEIIKQAYATLSNSNLNFVGNIEGNDIPTGKVNVAVCDGFVGNILLKFLEGTGSFIFGTLKEVYSKNIFSKLSALVAKDEIKAFAKKLDPDEYGGTPILGVNGIVFKCHGSSKAKAVKNAVKKAYDFSKTSALKQIEEKFRNVEVEEIEQSV